MTPIDAAWLAARGSGPYILATPGETCRLDADVTAPGTGFVVSAPGVTLDLNGHTLTYSALPCPVVTGDFGRLELTAPKVVLSDPVAIPVAGRTYAACVWMSQPGGTQNQDGRVVKVVLNVVGAGGKVLATSDPADETKPTTNGGGYNADAARCEWYAEDAGPVRLEVTVIPATNEPTTVDIGPVRLTASRDHAVLCSHDYQLPGRENLSPALRDAFRGCASPTIINSVPGKGGIVQGPGRSYAGHAVQGLSVHGVLVVRKVAFTLTGDDTSAVMAAMNETGSESDGRLVVMNTVGYEAGARVTVRARNVAAVDCSDACGSAEVVGNTFTDYPQVGVVLTEPGALHPNEGHRITGNTFRGRATTTNAYAVALTGCSDVLVEGNLIDATAEGRSGHGITVDAYDLRPVERVKILNNTVRVRSGPNAEYGQRMGARALRVRNTATEGQNGAIRDLLIEGNTFEAFAGEGGQFEAFGVRISLLNPDGRMDAAKILLRNNAIRAVVETTDPAYSAKGLVLDGVDAGIGLVVEKTTVASNHIPLAVCDSDGGDVSGVRLVGNTLIRSAAGAMRPDYKTTSAGYWIRRIEGVEMVDTTYEGGADSTITWRDEAAMTKSGITQTQSEPPKADPDPEPQPVPDTITGTLVLSTGQVYKLTGKLMS